MNASNINHLGIFLVMNGVISSMPTVLEMKSGKNVLCTFIYIVNHVVSREIYTTGKNFTLPPAVTGVTNITSGMRDSIHFDRQSQRNRHFNHFSFNKHLELENVICCLLKLHSFLCQISIPSRCLKSFCHFPSRSCPIFLSGPGCVD